MGTIRWHVVTEIVKVFVVALAIMLLPMVFVGVGKEAATKGLPFNVVLLTLPYILPELLRFALPACLLLATCSAFGRMAASNELTALKAAGVNPLQVIWPVWVLALVLSLVTFSLYDVCALWARPGLRTLLLRSTSEIALGFLRTNNSYEHQGMSITVKKVEGRVLIEPVLVSLREGDKRSMATAMKGRISVDRKAENLRFEFEDALVEVGDGTRLTVPGRFVHSIPLQTQNTAFENTALPAELGSFAMRTQIARERQNVFNHEHHPLGRNDPAVATQLKWHQKRLARLIAENPRRLANGFACLGFAIIGVSVAMRSRTGDLPSVFMWCFGPILLVYYPLLIVGEMLALRGVMGVFMVWLADVVLFGAGLILTWRWNRR
jgi:lipopolysaccharide export system permease protein